MSAQDARPRPPAVVKEAIANFVPRRGFVVVPKREAESSYIFDWGVRVRQLQPNQSPQDALLDNVEIARDDSADEDSPDGGIVEQESAGEPATGTISNSNIRSAIAWICLAEDECRKTPKLIVLSQGLTTHACSHLKKEHKLFSEKTQAEISRKRKADEEFEKLSKSPLYKNDPKRLVLLLETRRIVFHNIPFRFAEYTETMLLHRLTLKPDFQTTISIAQVRHTIIEMYAAAKKEVLHYLAQNKVAPTRSFSLVADFWTSKVKNTKFLGLRVYLIDNAWKFRSILLGIREFNPEYGERDSGLRGPFMRWITETLEDFNLTSKDFFGSTTDAGSDVLWMMQTGLKLHWHWCIPHLSNAATKSACGLHKNKSGLISNPGMVELIQRMAKTVYIVNSNERTGNLWSSLYQMLGHSYSPPQTRAPTEEETKSDENADSEADEDDSDTDDPLFVETMRPKNSASHRLNKATKLLNFQSHRFLGLLRVIRRLLERWDALKEWFKEIQAKAVRERKPSPYDFPLKRHNKVLVQLLSLLNRIAQSESPNQLDVLLELYMLRLDVLDLKSALPHYLSTPELPRVIYVSDLKPVVKKTRELLLRGFEKRFFSRYIITERNVLKKTPFLPEMQLFLDPGYKKWDTTFEAVVRLCCVSAGFTPGKTERQVRELGEHIRERIKQEMYHLMRTASSQQATAEHRDESRVPPPSYDRYASRFGQPTPQEGETSSVRTEASRVNDELAKWLDDQDMRLLIATNQGTASRRETILEFWERKSKEAGYEYLPKVVRKVYSTPSSSAQIERDFGDSGMMVTRNRSNLSAANIGMASFLKANKEFLDIAQVAELKKKDAEVQKPRISEVDIYQMIDENVDMMINHGFSSLNVSEDTFDDHYRHGHSF